MADLVIEKYNSVYNKIHCDTSIGYELGEYFTFQVPGARFIPAVRAKRWDGKIRMFNTGTHLIYGGVNHYIEALTIVFASLTIESLMIESLKIGFGLPSCIG